MTRKTIHEILSYFDEVCSNKYSIEEKVEWLYELDCQIVENIILPRTKNKFDLVEYSADDLDRYLIVERPYTEIYRYWLEQKIYYLNREMPAFNNAMAMYNKYLIDFASAYSRDCPTVDANKYKLY